MKRAVLIGALAAALLAAAPARADLPYPWEKRVKSAERFADGRQGRVAFALVDDRGRIHGVRKSARFYSASVVKVMLMVAYLNRMERLGQKLTSSRRALMGPMIRRSDNRTATIIRNIVGNRGLRKVARRAGMRRFATARIWGSSRITAADQARFFRRIDRFVPERFRSYARRLLATIVPSQRWGIPPFRPPGFALFFKGGWRGTESGRLTNQVGLLERGKVRVSVAILVDGSRSHGYGTRTIRGVAARLLRGLDDAYEKR